MALRPGLVGVLAALTASLFAQAPTPSQDGAGLEFEVVSIKRHTSSDNFMRVQTLPDGTYRLTNGQLPIGNASPVSVLPGNVVGVPDWAKTERYDVVAKPPLGSSAEQRRLMWQALFATRMKLVAHVEERDVKAFALVLARADGRLGPELKKSPLDCAAASSNAPDASVSDKTTHCGIVGSAASIVSGGITMDAFARNQVGGRAGGPVTDRTGLAGYYAFTLNFAPPRSAGSNASADDLPDFFTALREQLGLKIEPEKATVPYFVVDHIERPTED